VNKQGIERIDAVAGWRKVTSVSWGGRGLTELTKEMWG